MQIPSPMHIHNIVVIYKKKVIIIRGKEHMADFNKGINISHLKAIITKRFQMKKN